MKLLSCLSRLSKMTPLLACLFVLVTLSHLAFSVQAMGVVAIDYGTEWTKVSLVKPGLPFDVVLDRDSKRRIQSAVSFKKWGRDEEILFGTNAYNHATREPNQSFYALKMLLGRGMSDQDKPYLDQFSSIFGNHIVATDRATCALKRPYEQDATSSYPVLTVEELVAIQLDYAKKLAEEKAGEKVAFALPSNFNIGSFGGLETVITVPAFFTAAERQAMYDAAVLAGFRPRLVSDGTAIAFSYAQTRSFPEPEKHLFYDAGSGSVRATVVEFSTKVITADSILSIGTTQKQAIVINVLSVGWDRKAGGLALDLILRDALANEFDQQHGSQLGSGTIRTNPRAMARLLKEANRVKHILSANDAASSSVESLAEDIDFRTRIDRKAFEDQIIKQGLTKRFVQPIHQALQSAGLSLDQIKSVVLVGGTSRVPFVQEALRDTGIADSKLAQNVNADEAAVMGAALYGASFNPQFRMKDVRAHDLIPYPVSIKEADGRQQILYAAEAIEVESRIRDYPGVTEDFTFELEYDATSSQLLDGTPRSISKIEITGITEALKVLKETDQLSSVNTHVNVTIVTRPLGTYMVESATLTIQPKSTGGIAGALKSFFGVSSVKKASSSSSSNATNETTSSETDDATPGTGKEAEEEDDSAAEIPIKDKVIKLTARTIPSPDRIPPIDGEEQKKSKDRLWSMTQTASRKAAREEARNLLEAYLYRTRDLLSDETYQRVSKATERETISSKTFELFDWLNEEGDTAETSQLVSKKTSLQTMVQPLETRIEQSQLRVSAFLEFEQTLQQTREFVVQAKTNLSIALESNQSSKYSVTELDSLQATIEKDSDWFEKGQLEQSKRKENDDPALLVNDVEKRRKKLQDTMDKLKKRKIAKTRPIKKKSSPSSSDQDEKKKTTPPTTPGHDEL